MGHGEMGRWDERDRPICFALNTQHHITPAHLISPLQALGETPPRSDLAEFRPSVYTLNFTH